MTRGKIRRPGEPAVSRPHMPGYGILDAGSGTGLLPWKWAEERLSSARNYFLATTRLDGRPHVMIVWGVWLDGRFFFSTSTSSRKARNLAANPHCVICPESAAEAVILEGLAERTTDTALYSRFAAAYEAKYDWKLEESTYPLYAVRPVVAFAFREQNDFAGSATRWVFADGDQG